MAAEHTQRISENFKLDPERDIRNVHGAPGWFELTTPDPDSAASYLGKAFGWTFRNEKIGGSDYTIIRLKNGHEIGGIRKPLPGMPEKPFWATYVTVADVEDLAREAQEQGGTIILPPTDLGGAGRIVQIEHPVAGSLLGFEYTRAFD